MPGYALLPADPPDNEVPFPGGASNSGNPDLDEALWYRVELWDPSGAQTEMLLAIARTAMVAYSAYFAAAKDLPHRIITLRHRGKVLSRWSVARQ